MSKSKVHIEAGSFVFTFLTEKEKEKDEFIENTMLIFQISGKGVIQSSDENLETKAGDILLMRKNQFIKIAKTPCDGRDFRTVIIIFDEEFLQTYALQNEIAIMGNYNGKRNTFIPKTKFLQGLFTSLIPYGENPNAKISEKLKQLKLEESIELMLQAKPELVNFLFDFSQIHKIDLEKFINQNYQFNLPLEKFAHLSGRSLAAFKRDFNKVFNTPPRSWLQKKRLKEAHFQLENGTKKPSDVYLTLGFESLSHFSNSFKKLYGYSPTNLLLNQNSKE